MVDINGKIRDRFKFLLRIYEETNGSSQYYLDGKQVGEALGFDRSYSTDIYNYLKRKGLIEPYGAGLTLMITQYGIDEVEDALKEPDEPTEQFPPINQYNIRIENMTGGAIQQGTENSTINITSTDELNAVLSFVDELEHFVQSTIKDVEVNKEIIADIETIRHQAKSPKTKSSIIKETLLSLKSTLEGGIGGVIGGLATPKANELIIQIDQFLNSL